jgi:hypothetical protein
MMMPLGTEYAERGSLLANEEIVSSHKSLLAMTSNLKLDFVNLLSPSMDSFYC